jgi:hypothetical protein
MVRQPRRLRQSSRGLRSCTRAGAGTGGARGFDRRLVRYEAFHRRAHPNGTECPDPDASFDECRADQERASSEAHSLKPRMVQGSSGLRNQGRVQGDTPMSAQPRARQARRMKSLQVRKGDGAMTYTSRIVAGGEPGDFSLVRYVRLEGDQRGIGSDLADIAWAEHGVRPTRAKIPGSPGPAGAGRKRTGRSSLLGRLASGSGGDCRTTTHSSWERSRSVSPGPAARSRGSRGRERRRTHRCSAGTSTS